MSESNTKLDSYISPTTAARCARIMRSALDHTLAGVSLVLLAPLIAVVALAIKLDSPGPVFSAAGHADAAGGFFGMRRFRTERLDESGRPKQGEMTLTRVGKWLRRTNLDELPRLLSVLAGKAR